MAPKSNNMIPNAHFHKDWQAHIKTWFGQPFRKVRRRLARTKKACVASPKPVGLLRPAVRCPTIRYNIKQRPGRGFTLEELSRAGYSKRLALSLGIAVDTRRRSKSYESLQLNVQRLKEYKQRLIVFPMKGQKALNPAAAKDCLIAQQNKLEDVMPIKTTYCKYKARQVTDEEKAFSATSALRKALTDMRLAGKRAVQKEREEANLLLSGKK